MLINFVFAVTTGNHFKEQFEVLVGRQKKKCRVKNLCNPVLKLIPP